VKHAGEDHRGFGAVDVFAAGTARALAWCGDAGGVSEKCENGGAISGTGSGAVSLSASEGDFLGM
jgi:hypothetical protein